MINIKKASSEALLQMISVYKNLKINKDFIKECMIEINLRENNGESFDYNKFDKKAKLLSDLNNGFVIIFQENLLINIQEVLISLGIEFIKISNKEIFINDSNNHEEIKKISPQIEIKLYRESLQDATSSEIFKIGKVF
jgi:hypothetical protein